MSILTGLTFIVNKTGRNYIVALSRLQKMLLVTGNRGSPNGLKTMCRL